MLMVPVIRERKLRQGGTEEKATIGYGKRNLVY